MKSIPSALEALLFIYGEPIEVKKAAQILEIKPKDVEAAADELSAVLQADKRGLMLMRHDERLQLVTRPDFKDLLEKVIKAELHEALTPAALETLSIVAYGGPILRSEIDYIRGVNSSFILRSLLLRGLIDRTPSEKHGNAFLYSPSFEFLKHIGVASAKELPEYQKFTDLAMKVKQPMAAEGVVLTAEVATIPPLVESVGVSQEPASSDSSRRSVAEENTSQDEPKEDKPKKKEPSLSDEIAEMFQSQQRAPEGLSGSEFDGEQGIE